MDRREVYKRKRPPDLASHCRSIVIGKIESGLRVALHARGSREHNPMADWYRTRSGRVPPGHASRAEMEHLD